MWPFLRNSVHISRLRHARGFASSSPRRFGLEVPIEVTAGLLRSIHDLSGLSYGVTIPLTAIALRSIITLPLSIYSQKKINRRVELRPLFFHWGNLIGVRAVAQQKARNIDLRGNQEAYTKMMATVQNMVPHYFSRF